jgi:hypothetical protein
MRALAAQHLLPGEGDDIELGQSQVHGEGGRGRVADRQALAVVGDPVAVRHAHARGRAVPGEDDIAVRVDRLEVGISPYGAFKRAHVLELELLHDVRDPAFAKAFPGSMSTPGRAPSSDHSAISTAPVSEAGTMPMR